MSRSAYRNMLVTKKSRIILLLISLLLVASAAALPTGFASKVSATIQQSAKKTVTPPGKPSPRRTLQQSRESRIVSFGKTNPDGSGTGDQIVTAEPVQRTMEEISADQASRPVGSGTRILKPEHEVERDDLPQNPGSPLVSQWPLADKNAPVSQTGSPQTLGTSFDGATGPTETGAFPPDTMGAVGPTQFFSFLNGRMRTFNKTTGAADGVVNVDSDVFFASVITPPLVGEVTFTSDPQVRFDRLSNRWFVVIIDVILNSTTGATTRANRVLYAVNDAASNGTISASTVWTFYQFQGDAVNFTDYESLGIDANALYIGGDMFSLVGPFVTTKAFVIPKAPLLTASAATVWSFNNLLVGSAGPFAPRGVDNYDTTNTGPTAVGYFIGVDNATFGTLMMRRITNPSNLVAPGPTISANISITVAATEFPTTVPHLGNTGGTNGNLDSLDDRLYAAHLRNGRLWTAHSIGVNSSGVATSNGRAGVRWYELQNVATTPTVVQSGTLFDNAAASPRFYWIPSILVSGQGHSAAGCSIAGTNERINAFTTGRLVGDTLGTLREGPGPNGVAGALPGYTASSTAYNPPGNSPPGISSRRWGDYSFTSLDPKDDMTMWTINEYCNGANTYGVRVIKLIAPPPPPTNTPSPGSVAMGTASANITVTGTAPAGQGFYDPGANPPAPHTPFTHIAASGVGITVNSITFNTPTQVTLNVSTVGSTTGSKTITITNPDGQTTTVSVMVGPTAAKVSEFTANRFDDGQVLLEWKSVYEVDNLGFNVYREVNGKRTRINPQTIAGSALVTGANVALTAGKSYVWADEQSHPGARYWLEDVDLGGKGTFTGPVSLTSKIGKAPNAKQSLMLARVGLASSQMTVGQGSRFVERQVEVGDATSDTTKIQLELAAGSAVKLSVNQEGWYRVTQPELINAGLSSTLDPRKLQLFVDGRQVPIVVKGEQDGRFDIIDSVEFYGAGLNSAVSRTHVYWLVSGTQLGSRVKTVKSGGGSPASTSFIATVERKDRTVYFSSLKNGEAENFFGQVIVAGNPVDQSMTISNLASTGGAATLEVYLQGVTLSAHKVRVTLNGTAVGTMTFDGQERGKGSFSVPQSRLREGENAVELTALGGGSDISLVDTLRVSYPHTFNADSNLLRVGVKAGQPVTIGGFTSPDLRVIDITDVNNPQELSGTVGGSKTGSNVTVTPTGSGNRLLMAFAASRVLSPDDKPNQPSNWHQEGLQYDYVMITTHDLQASLQPLKSLRESQGLKVALIDVEDLYDEFSFGNKTPQAIKSFLEFTRTGWRQLPRFVLFAGDSSYDPNNYLGYGDTDLVPTKLYDSAYLQTASDDWFVDFSNSGLPEIAVGRLPVRTAAEATSVVAKIIGYESSSGANSLLLASDLNDGFDFAAVADSLKTLAPGGMQVQEIARGGDNDRAVKAQILSAINQGRTIVNYVGHGSSNSWRGDILGNEDASSMTNRQKLAFFVMMTCLNGKFDDPVTDSLAESVMKATGGAAAVWASSAQCEPDAQIAVNRELYRLLFGDASITIGEAAMRAKQMTADPDVRRSWILFGDPAMKLK